MFFSIQLFYIGVCFQHGSPTVITNYFRFIDVIRVIKDVAMVDSDRVNACECITSLANYYFKIMHG